MNSMLIPGMFHGSYAPEDITFLLKPIHMKPMDIAEKEQRIQSGKQHYSEMLSYEPLPSQRYLAAFRAVLQRNSRRFARNIYELATLIAERQKDVPGPIVLVSLARAGTPIGVFLRRALSRLLSPSPRSGHIETVCHYSISIIRDRGIDTNALRYLLYERHYAPRNFVFVDGWTGKGVIRQELRTAITQFNTEHGTDIQPDLHVLTDPAGIAEVAPSTDDYLVPTSLLNAIVSGLISRTVLNADHIGPDDFHGCVYYREYEQYDLSNEVVQCLDKELQQIILEERRKKEENSDWKKITDKLPGNFHSLTTTEKFALRTRREVFLKEMMRRYALHDINHVKPGLGESTRVLLRRVPHLLLLKEPAHEDVAHLRILAEEKSVPIEHEPSLPYLAVALIRELPCS